MEEGKIRISGDICNLPDLAKEWATLQNGCKIYMEGITHDECYGGGTTDRIRISYVLTNLKKK